MSEHRRPTQRQRVLDYMHDFGSITSLEAIVDLGVHRLASRVSELKKMGYPIASEYVPVKNRYGETGHVKRYWVEEQKQ